MKRILLYLFTLLIIVFILDRISYWMFNKFIFEKTFSGESRGGVNYLLEKNTRNDFYIFGNSRSLHHIDPTLLKDFHQGNGFNAGISGLGGLIYTDLLLDLILQHNQKPKSILIQLDPVNFRYNDVKTQLNAMSLFFDKSNRIKSYQEQYDLGDKLFSNFKLTRINNKFINVLYNYLKPDTHNLTGFIPLQGSMDTTLPQDNSTKDKSGPIQEAKIRAIKNISKVCLNQNINLYIVLEPSYHNVLNDSLSHSFFMKLMAELPNIKWIDFSDRQTIPSLEPAKYWKDRSHLNAKGAEIFSKTLNEALKKFNANP